MVSQGQRIGPLPVLNNSLPPKIFSSLSIHWELAINREEETMKITGIHDNRAGIYEKQELQMSRKLGSCDSALP